MRRIRLTAMALASLVLGIVMACSDNTGTGGAVSLAGTYSLVSLFFGVITTTATGTLTFTDNSFTTNIHVTAPVDSTIILGGGYSAKHTAAADSIYLGLPTPLPQIPGTFLIKGASRDTLILNLSLSSGGTPTPLVTTWKKQ